MPITPDPFTAFTPLQKAMLYRVLLSYKEKTQNTVAALMKHSQQLDGYADMKQIAIFQLDQITALQQSLEQNISVDDLALMPYLNEHLIKVNKSNDFFIGKQS